MSEERKKPLWPWIVALLIGLPPVRVFGIQRQDPARLVCEPWRELATPARHDALAVKAMSANVKAIA